MTDRSPALPLWFSGRRQKYGYAFAVLAVLLCTALSSAMQPYFQLPNIVMVYLAGVALVAFLAGHGASVLASFLATLAFDFFNVPPHFLLTHADGQYLLTLVIMLSISLLISGLTARLRDQLAQSQLREQHTARLYALTRELAATRGVEMLSAVICRHIEMAFPMSVKLLLPGKAGRLQAQAGSLLQWDALRADRIWEKTETPETGFCRVLEGASGPVGLLMLSLELDDSSQERLLRTMMSAAAVAIERAKYVEAVQAERMNVESERLRNSLLSAVSHDLRTPLATIVGASSSLMEDAGRLDAGAIDSLHRVVFQSSMRMRGLVENILDMARLQSGPIHLRQEWQAVEEVLGATLEDMRPWLQGRQIVSSVPVDLPLLRFDPVLIQRVLINLIENAVKYTPPGSCIMIDAGADEGSVWVSVSDNGPGLPEEEREKVFEKFYRIGSTPAGGAGLGLSICRAIVEAHGGFIRVLGSGQGGARFVFTLPLPEAGAALTETGS